MGNNYIPHIKIGKINKCPKDIGLGNIFRHFFMGKEKCNYFYIFHKSDIKIFLKLSITKFI